ncbi:MAG: conjugal transfer protein TraF [Pseudomonadota bacterium]
MIILLFAKQYSQANDNFYQDAARGWFWFEPKPKKNTTLPDHAQEEIAEHTSPTERLQQLRQQTEQKLHQAIIEPTTANIIAYIKAQQHVTRLSENFSQAWQLTLAHTPELDTRLERPVSSQALQLYYKQQNAAKKAKIKALANTYGLLYFFRGDCPYCQAMASTAQEFAANYNWSLTPVQIGEMPLKEFPQAKQDNGIASGLNITHVPALIAVNPVSNKIIPLAYGYVSISEIEQQAYLLLSEVKNESDF